MVRYYEPSEMKRRGWMYILGGSVPIVISVLLWQWLFIIFGGSLVYSGVNLIRKANEWEKQIAEHQMMGKDLSMSYSQTMNVFPFKPKNPADVPIDQSKMEEARRKRMQNQSNPYVHQERYEQPDQYIPQQFIFCEQCGYKMAVNTINCEKCGHSMFA
ncbi:MAG: hypothetical protein INQ03_23025 [Candidatus Heimdallarchaeota archaeon]|nr:hypothetical protein [Candidatus Heimdallarchaeota archaeon]